MWLAQELTQLSLTHTHTHNGRREGDTLRIFTAALILSLHWMWRLLLSIWVKWHRLKQNQSVLTFFLTATYSMTWLTRWKWHGDIRGDETLLLSILLFLSAQSKAAVCVFKSALQSWRWCCAVVVWSYLQTRALVREGRAEEGRHDAHDRLRHVALQDGVCMFTITCVVAHLQ